MYKRQPQNPSYKNYGGRGITVCERWLCSLENFILDMGPCPPGLSLDRIDNDGNYEPLNCRWATRAEQNSNSRHNRRITFQGKTQTLVEWCRKLGFVYSTVNARLNRYGWSEDRIFSAPRKK